MHHATQRRRDEGSRGHLQEEMGSPEQKYFSNRLILGIFARDFESVINPVGHLADYERISTPGGTCPSLRRGYQLSQSTKCSQVMILGRQPVSHCIPPEERANRKLCNGKGLTEACGNFHQIGTEKTRL